LSIQICLNFYSFFDKKHRQGFTNQESPDTATNTTVKKFFCHLLFFPMIFMEVVIPVKDLRELIAVELQGKVEIVSDDFSLKDLKLGTLSISVSIC
jgi:hypothetical protein